MPTQFVDGLPERRDDSLDYCLRLCGGSAFLRSARYLAGCSLGSAKLNWVVEREPVRLTESASRLPRQIHVGGSALWCGLLDKVVAEILDSENGTVRVRGRDAATGRQLWDNLIPIPEAADWAEPTPAWPGAPTEEIHAFFADDPRLLVVCLFRESRRRGLSSPAQAIQVMTLPPYACQTDAVRLDPLTGKAIWQASFRDLRVGIIERTAFAGTWSHSPKVGLLELETGANAILYESPHQLGWPVRDGACLAIPWHSKREVGVDWIDMSGRRINQAAWRHSGVRCTWLHNTDAGLALQTNDQTLWWLGQERSPLWTVRAKPYIYRVHRAPGTNVFVGTDGNGGRLFGFDAITGQETLNLKPPVGGAGTLTRVPGQNVLVAKFWTSPRNTFAGRLLVFCMRERSHNLNCEHSALLGACEHGALCLAGSRWQRLAIVDVRSLQR
jgi:hypothetical protein